MPTLQVQATTGEYRFTVEAGQSVRDVLDTTELRVRAACGGNGSCGACVVRLLRGDANSHTLAEFQKLTPEEREQGCRLACQLRPRGDIEILLDHPAPPSQWKSIPPEDLAPPPGRLPELEKHVYGVAVDLGTTHIRVSLWDRRRGQRIASRRGPNPQGVFGADVLTRLDAAKVRPERARELAGLARDAIVQAVRDILARDVGEVAPMLAEIGKVVVVGNTAMLALLSGNGGEALLQPDNWQRPVDCRPCDPAWLEAWRMPNAALTMPAPIAGFVGSDLAADLIATRLLEGPPGAMLLDVGTNTEIALWDGERLHVTSVPGGPAFEGVGIRFGMPAEPGAVHRVVAASGAPPFACETVAGAAARGFCGSGLVDAVALLLAAGVVKPSGRFAIPPGSEGYRLDPANPRTAIGPGDIDAFQRAKAATAAAMAELLKQAGMDWPDLGRLCICGAFGRRLDLGHAQAVGLLPQVEPARLELAADATLAGCERLLLTADAEGLVAEIGGKLNAINLSRCPAYDESYIEHLRLRPFPPIT